MFWFWITRSDVKVPVRTLWSEPRLQQRQACCSTREFPRAPSSHGLFNFEIFFLWLFIYTTLRVTKVFVRTPRLYGPTCIRIWALCGHHYLRSMATMAQVCSEAANVHFALSLEMPGMREQAGVSLVWKHAYFFLLSERKFLLRIKYMMRALREAALPPWWTITDINTPAEANPDLCLPTSDALSFYPGSQILPPLSSPFKVNKTFKDLLRAIDLVCKSIHSSFYVLKVWKTTTVSQPWYIHDFQLTQSQYIQGSKLLEFLM